jgi:hypothetical protein
MAMKNWTQQPTRNKRMARGDKKELTSTEIKKQAIHSMLESLILGKSEEAGDHLHDYLQLKTRELIVGESDSTIEEQSKEAAFANSGSVMDDDVKGDIKFENGGKKTLKKHGNAPKELDDDNVGKTKFKSGGKQPARTLEPTPKPAKFDDGRKFDLGTVNEDILDTLDEALLDEIYTIVMEKAPSAGLSKAKKSEIVKKAKKGEDIGKKGKGFKEVEAKAKKYGAKNPEAVAAAAMWKNVKR